MAEATVNGVNLAYDVHGEGEPVLLVCGTGQPAFSYQLFQVPALTGAGYQVVTYDNRGVPPSEATPPPYTVKLLAEDAAALIEHLGLGPCRVAGTSLGALITQELALARPDLVRAAVMMGTFGRQDAYMRYLTRSWVELDESGIELPRLYDVISGMPSLFAPATLRDEDGVQLMVEFQVAAPAWTGPGRLGQHLADREYDNRLEALGGVRVPSMVIAFLARGVNGTGGVGGTGPRPMISSTFARAPSRERPSAAAARAPTLVLSTRMPSSRCSVPM